MDEPVAAEVEEKNPHAVELGRLGGMKTSERKAAAARENGKLGGCTAEERALLATLQR